MKIFALLLLTSVLVLSAADPSRPPQREQKTPPPSPPPTAFAGTRATVAPAPQPPQILYKPPRLGAPRISTGPGTRGGDDNSIRACVLAPDHAGLTLSEHPVLFWYQTQTGGVRIEVTLVAPGQPDPLVQLVYASAPEGKLQRLDLKERGVSLQPGIEYRWSVAVVPDPERRSKDLVATGIIKRIVANPDLAARLARTERSEKAVVYAAEGIWYDALQSTLDLVASHPSTPQYREQAAWLNRQIGLTNVANYCLGFAQ